MTNLDSILESRDINLLQSPSSQSYHFFQGTFHAKMGSIKDRNGMDLTEAEDIKKRWQEEYTEELCKKRSSRPR